MKALGNSDQIQQMKTAIAKVVAMGPDFLKNDISAYEMAHTMIQVVDDYWAEAERQGTLQAKNEEAGELMEVLAEIKGCGSGFLEKRCDAACVARTINFMLEKFV